MSTITDRKALLTAQLECLEALSEDDIGTEVYVRDFVDAAWEGPYVLEYIVSPEDLDQPFEVVQGKRTMTYRLATKTLPIEPQTVTLIPWSGGECPIEKDCDIIIQCEDGILKIVDARQIDYGQWSHTITWGCTSTAYFIIAYRPITIDIEER